MTNYYLPITTYASKRIVILGLARQGVALARYLAQAGARVVVSDQQPAAQLQTTLAALSDLTIEYALGGHPANLLEGADLLCLSGGVDVQVPLAQEALRRGIVLSNDSQIFMEQCPPGVTTIGITGSAGKTTTTTLVGRMCHHMTARQTWVGGNIGHPLIGDVDAMRPGDYAVMELSSFQLEMMTRSPHIAAVLNLTPNHLDRHGTMEAYIAAKQHIVRYQTAQDVAVLSWDNDLARNLNVPAARTIFFSDTVELPEGAFVRDSALVWRGAGTEEVVAPLSAIELRGQHNVRNVLAACAISGAAGVSVDAMRASLTNFTGVAHRLELVRAVNGARWYNDSIASAPERVMAALHAFEEPIVLLAGGRDKKLPWDAWAALVQARAKHVVLFGEAAALIERALVAAQVDAARYTMCNTLAEAVMVAARHAQPGDVVLLSPGCTSFDAFKDFEERGAKFREWVSAL